MWRRLLSTSARTAAPVVVTRQAGVINTTEYRLFFDRTDVGAPAKAATVSPWHDIPLRPTGAVDALHFNYVNEIPKGTRGKMEIATKEEFNPIKQDVKKGELRYFKLGDIPFNYGCLPQTWEDPAFAHPDTRLGGDNDPIDAVEIGAPIACGIIAPVKVLGVLAMIDEGETDWKVLVISRAHPLASKMNCVADIDKHLPGTTHAVREWFRDYKVPEGKKQNSFALNERFQEPDYALHVIQETHTAWSSLLAGKSPAGKLWLPTNSIDSAKK